MRVDRDDEPSRVWNQKRVNFVAQYRELTVEVFGKTYADINPPSVPAGVDEPFRRMEQA